MPKLICATAPNEYLPQAMANQAHQPLLFEYIQTAYPEWIKQLAEALRVPIQDNTILFDAPVGAGYSKAISLEEGLTVGVQHYSLGQEALFIRQPTKQFGVLIYIFQFDVQEQGVQYQLNDVHQVSLDPGIYHTIRIVNAQTRHELRFGAGTWVRGVSFFLEEGWIKKHISGDLSRIFDYLSQVDFFKEFVPAKQQRLLEEILKVPADHPYLDVFLRSRLWRLLDKVLENLLQRDTTELPEKLSENDFAMVQRVELQLIQNYRENFPSIERLSRVALMSESKLKKLFKQSYGMGMYEYYQKNRMHQAREMILSRQYSITEVGTLLGYQNLSNFSAGFRKEFGCLPSELLTVS